MLSSRLAVLGITHMGGLQNLKAYAFSHLSKLDGREAAVGHHDAAPANHLIQSAGWHL